MNCGFLIAARLGSQRLRAKHLQLVGGTPIILYLVRRIRQEFAAEIKCGEARVVIVTADEPENRTLAEIAGSEADVFYGAVHNIPLRQNQAIDHYGFEQIVSVDGDDILCSPAGMRAVAELLGGGADYAQTSNLPFGMNTFGYTRKFLSGALARHPDATLETGWGRIFSGHSPAVASYPDFPQDRRLRFTLDYADDLAFFRAVIEALGPRALTATDRDIVQLVLERTLFSLNATLADEYWRNFYRQMANEQSTKT